MFLYIYFFSRTLSASLSISLSLSLSLVCAERTNPPYYVMRVSVLHMKKFVFFVFALFVLREATVPTTFNYRIVFFFGSAIGIVLARVEPVGDGREFCGICENGKTFVETGNCREENDEMGSSHTHTHIASKFIFRPHQTRYARISM